MDVNRNLKKLEQENAELRWQLDEANESIEAIRTGQVDAIILSGETGPQVYTLKSADQTYRVFIEKMKEGAVTLNREGLIVYSNSTFAFLVKLPLSEVIGASFADFISPEKKEQFLYLFEKGWQTESKGEICLLNADHEDLAILISLTTMEIDEGIALGVIITDLTEQKKTEKELKLKNEELVSAHKSLATLNNKLEQRVRKRTRELSSSREHFKFLADNIPVIVWTSKPNGDVDYFNKKWYDYTGITEKESHVWGWQKIIHPEDLPNTVQSWNDSLLSGNEYHVEYRFLRAADNTYRWHNGIAVPFKNANGEIITWLGICADIEDQKIELAKKDEFISMASHELKTPVSILKAFTHLLLSVSREENNTTAVDHLLKMDKQINRLIRLISDLLDATIINAGELKFEKEQFDWNDMIHEVVEHMQMTTKSHTIQAEVCESRLVFGDRTRLGQVISNLLSNAIKYSPNADSVKISSVIDNSVLKFCVQDFGIGIPQKQQSKLFSRFFRASEVKTNTFPGLGLGLYISNEIIKRHSGIITFTSDEGYGSTFCFKIPVQ